MVEIEIVTTEASGVEQVLQRVAERDQRVARNIHRLQESLLRGLVKRPDALGVVGEGQRMDHAVELHAPLGQFVAEPGDLVFVLDVADMNLLVAEQLRDVPPHVVVLHDVDAFRPRLAQARG